MRGVAATPGIDFGSNQTKRYVRFAYTQGMADLEEMAFVTSPHTAAGRVPTPKHSRNSSRRSPPTCGSWTSSST